MKTAILILILLWPFVANGAEPHLLYRGVDGFTAMSQGDAPSCVGASTAKALELLHPEYQFSAEWIYGQCRVDNDAKYPRGAHCKWAAVTLHETGCIVSQDYALLGVDLTTYSAERAADYGIRGPPESLLPIAAEYKTSGYTHVKTWDTLDQEIRLGHPVIVGSSVGFGPKAGQSRDRNGELRTRWWSVWNHAMVIIGVDDRGALVLNSWGPDWVTGPKRYEDEPDGSFWVTRYVAERIISYNDSYSIHPIAGLR